MDEKLMDEVVTEDVLTDEEEMQAEEMWAEASIFPWAVMGMVTGALSWVIYTKVLAPGAIKIWSKVRNRKEIAVLADETEVNEVVSNEKTNS